MHEMSALKLAADASMAGVRLAIAATDWVSGGKTLAALRYGRAARSS